MIVSAVAVGIGAYSVQAQSGVSKGVDPFDLYFTGGGAGTVDTFNYPPPSPPPTLTTYNETGFAAVDPDTSIDALTFALPESVGEGVVDIYNNSFTTLVGAIDFYDIGSDGYMAEYANIGGQLDETISGDQVPSGSLNINEDASGNFVWYAGSQNNNPDGYRLDNDYFGNITGTTEIGPNTAPDGGSTLAMLGCALTFAGAASRRFRK